MIITIIFHAFQYNFWPSNFTVHLSPWTCLQFKNEAGQTLKKVWKLNIFNDGFAYRWTRAIIICRKEFKMRCELFFTIKDILQNMWSYIISLTQLNSKLSIVSLSQHQDCWTVVAVIIYIYRRSVNQVSKDASESMSYQVTHWEKFWKEIMNQYHNTD